MEKTLFIFGYGYSTSALAKRLLRDDWNITVTSRDRVKRKELERLGIKAIDFDDDDAVRHGLARASYLLSSVPPSKQADPVMANYRADILASEWHWVGYLSSTSVYGDHNGAWVDEQSHIQQDPRGRIERRIYAEYSWLNLQREHLHPVHIFRLAGIYGPGRNPLKQLQQGRETATYKEGQFFSRIYVDDIATILHASMLSPQSEVIYNVADDEPAPSHKVLEYAATLLNIPAPSLVAHKDAKLSEMAQSFWSQNKRVSNKNVKKALDIELEFPDFRKGLEHLLKTA